MPLVKYVEVDREKAMRRFIPRNEPWEEDAFSFCRVFSTPGLEKVIREIWQSCVKQHIIRAQKIAEDNIQTLFCRWHSKDDGDQFQVLLTFREEAHIFFCQHGLCRPLPTDIVERLMAGIAGDFTTLTTGLYRCGQVAAAEDDETPYPLSEGEAVRLLKVFIERLRAHLQSPEFVEAIRSEITIQLEKDYPRNVFYGRAWQRAIAVDRWRCNKDGELGASLHYTQGDVSGQIYCLSLQSEVLCKYLNCGIEPDEAFFETGFGFLDKDNNARSFAVFCDRINPANWVIIVQLNADAPIHLRRVAFFKSINPLPGELRRRKKDIFQGEFDQKDQFLWQSNQDFSARLREVLNNDELYARLRTVVDSKSRIKIRKLAFIKALPMMSSPAFWEKLDSAIDWIIGQYAKEVGLLADISSFSSSSASAIIRDHAVCGALLAYKAALIDKVRPSLLDYALIQDRMAILNKVNEVRRSFCAEKMGVLDADSLAEFKEVANAITLPIWRLLQDGTTPLVQYVEVSREEAMELVYPGVEPWGEDALAASRDAGCEGVKPSEDACFKAGFGFLDRDGNARSFAVFCDRFNLVNWVIAVQLNADAPIHLRKIAFFRSVDPLPGKLRERKDIFQGEFDPENRLPWQQYQDFSTRLRDVLNDNELYARLRKVVDFESRIKIRKLAFIKALPMMSSASFWEKLDPAIDRIIGQYGEEAGFLDDGSSFSSSSSSSSASTVVRNHPVCSALLDYKTALKDEVSPLLDGVVIQDRTAILNKFDEVSRRFCAEEIDVLDADSRAVFKVIVNAITLLFTLTLANWYHKHKTGDFLFFNRSPASYQVLDLAKRTIAENSLAGG